MSAAGAGSRGSTSGVHVPVPQPKQINDNVFEIYKPAGIPLIEIVFFHGLQFGDDEEAHMSTWMSRDRSDCWLRWLQDIFPGARVLTVSYDALSRRTYTYTLAETLLLSMLRAEIGQHGCPVLLVGHSFGGLVMKAICTLADTLWHSRPYRRADEYYKFLVNLKGLFFFGTPHAGSNLPEVELQAPFPWVLSGLSWDTVRVANKFREGRARYRWRTCGVGEHRATILGNFRGLVVSQGSSSVDMDEYYLVDANHFDICRPRDKSSDIFQALTEFIRALLGDLKDEKEAIAGRKDLMEGQENGLTEPMDVYHWYDDPITWERMCDPVKCTDGRTYDRWTIVDKRMIRSPYDRNMTFGILCDDIDARSRLFKAFPQQESEFRSRRKKYRDEALQHVRANPVQFADALEKLTNVVKWRPLDSECQNELAKIRVLASQQSSALNRLPQERILSTESPVHIFSEVSALMDVSQTSGMPVLMHEDQTFRIPVLRHEDLMRANEIEGRGMALILILLYVGIWIFII